MVTLYGKTIKKEELLRSIGSVEQVGGIKLFKMSEGVEKDVRVALMRTGELNLLITIDRCLDIANAEYRGIPIGWISPTGIASPYLFEPEKFGWLRGFFAGLLTTCGLTYMGAPTIDQREELGLHGRISYSPAKLSSVGGRWEGDEYIIWIEGEMREAKVFEPNLVLRRRIESRLGGRKIKIFDEVVNEGWIRQPLMILYHINIGFPIVADGSRFISTSRLYVPRDEEARKDAEKYDQIHEPAKEYREKVYFHDLAVDEDGYAYAAVVNEKLLDGIGVYVRFKKDQLNRFIEWKMLGEGTYVIGMEPANALVMGRDKEREWGTLQYISAQEHRRFELEIGVIVGEEIRSFKERVAAITRGVKSRMIESVEEFIEETKAQLK